MATRADIIDYHRLNHLATSAAQPTKRVEESATAAGLTPVAIDGTGKAAVHAWADPAALAQAAAGARGRHRVTLLSPFDSLVWDRKRTLRMFGFEHSLEAYVPKPKRVHGYFTMPLLAGGRLVGRADPVRRGKTLVARQLSLETPSRRRAYGPGATGGRRLGRLFLGRGRAGRVPASGGPPARRAGLTRTGARCGVCGQCLDTS